MGVQVVFCSILSGAVMTDERKEEKIMLPMSVLRTGAIS